MILFEEKVAGKIIRPVTIKILHATHCPNMEFVKKFRHEAKLAARQLHRSRRINLRGGENDSASLERAI